MSVLLTAILAAEMFAMAPADISSSHGCAMLRDAVVVPEYVQNRSHLPAVALLSSIPKHCRGTKTPEDNEMVPFPAGELLSCRKYVRQKLR